MSNEFKTEFEQCTTFQQVLDCVMKHYQTENTRLGIASKIVIKKAVDTAIKVLDLKTRTK